VAEIEAWLGRRSKRPPRPEEVAPQFDTEDGSDRRDWQRPADDLRFVAPEVQAALSRARRSLYDVEFLLDVDGAVVRGVVDCLWEDEDGGRHLLAVTSGDGPLDWPLGVVLAAVA